MKRRKSGKSPTSSRKTKSQKTRRKKNSWFKRLLLSLFLFGSAIAFTILLVYAVWASIFDLKQLGKMPERSIVYDIDTREYSHLHGENRITVPISEVSSDFKDALLAREDTRFYSHKGIDPKGILRAAVRNIFSGSIREGASTITQQLARNSYPLGGQNFHRKLLEAMLAIRIEQNFSKDQILEFYVNRIYYGSSMYGVETASRAYFNKPSKALTLGESAMLAGLIRSPNRFSPFRNPEGATRERNVVLQRMAHLGMESQEKVDQVIAKKEKIAKPKPSYQENYVMDAVVRELHEILDDHHADEGGLKIYTTIDANLTEIAQNALNKHLTQVESRSGYRHPTKKAYSAAMQAAEVETPYLQGAVVIIDNRSGAIRTIIGGRDFKQSKYNRALQSQRPVGSAFKPFIYLTAFNKGMLPGYQVSDGPISQQEFPHFPRNWHPGNSDGKFQGFLPASQGLIRSRNTMSIRVGEFASLESIIQLAATVNLSKEIPTTPASYLGAFEASLRDLTSAYTIFPNNGERKQSYLIERIDDKNGIPIYRATHGAFQSISPDPVWLTNTLLTEVMTSGTGSAARQYGFKGIAGGKTGTTNDYKDAWFLGFTKSLTCGVWVGMDKPQKIMGGGYASALALPVWSTIMAQAPTNRYPASEKFLPPSATRNVLVCSQSNQLATVSCERARTSYPVALTAPLSPQFTCAYHTGPIRHRTDAPGSEDSFPERAIHSIKKFFRFGR